MIISTSRIVKERWRYQLDLFALLFVENVWGLYTVFGIISFAHSGEFIADQNIAMEFGDEADRPTYIGMSKTLTGPFFLFGPIIGGGIVKLWGYQSMFATALIISILSFVIIRFFVDEHRHSNWYFRFDPKTIKFWPRNWYGNLAWWIRPIWNRLYWFMYKLNFIKIEVANEISLRYNNILHNILYIYQQRHFN